VDGYALQEGHLPSRCLSHRAISLVFAHAILFSEYRDQAERFEKSCPR